MKAKLLSIILHGWVSDVCMSDKDPHHVYPSCIHVNSLNLLPSSFPQSVMPAVEMEHVVSIGVVISYAFFAIATHILLNPNARAGSRQGQLVGYSPAGLPFYSLQTENLWGGAGTPPWVHLKNFIKQVLNMRRACCPSGLAFRPGF